MARNIEIKAKANNFKRQSDIARGLADGEAVHLGQVDTFFCVPSGRLKLRDFGDGKGELIQYNRADSIEPTESNYLRYPTNDPFSLKETLTNALGIRAVVEKKRTVYLTGQTRIHLDEVAGLGEYLELEVVLKDGQDTVFGTRIAGELMQQLEIRRDDLVATAYVDLLEQVRRADLPETGHE